MAVFIALIGALIAGEAIALGSGMYFSGKEGRRWLLGRNLVWLLTDLAGGILLCLTVWMKQVDPELFWLIPGVLSLTHAWRVLECLLGLQGAFCFNRSLSIVNVIKLVGLVILAIYLIWYDQQQPTFDTGVLV